MCLSGYECAKNGARQHVATGVETQVDHKFVDAFCLELAEDLVELVVIVHVETEIHEVANFLAIAGADNGGLVDRGIGVAVFAHED